MECKPVFCFPCGVFLLISIKRVELASDKSVHIVACHQNTAGRLCDAQIREWCTSLSIIWVRSSSLAVGLYWKRPCWTLRLKPWPLLLIRSIISGICLWRSVCRFKVFKVRSLSFLLFFLCLSIHLCVSFLFSVQCQSRISVITQYAIWSKTQHLLVSALCLIYDKNAASSLSVCTTLWSYSAFHNTIWLVTHRKQ